MYANSESQKGGYNSYNGGRSFGGRGGRSNWRGKGRGHGNFQAQRDLINRTYDKREIHLISHAFVCDKLGDYASDYPDRLLKLQETSEKKATIRRKL